MEQNIDSKVLSLSVVNVTSHKRHKDLVLGHKLKAINQFKFLS